MAKITDTTIVPPAPKPPRTFTLELDEAELATLVLVLGATHPEGRENAAKVAANSSWNSSKKAAQYLVDNPGFAGYSATLLYTTLRRGFDA